ncbi:MAG: tyrosine-type recombinase/integrase, partial [Nitrospirae bacterium]|nr:tyrosine-type recombinase/integrase [Nitrospirota bacterium]
MGLTKRKDGWYVEFPVIDEGKVLTLARGTPGAKVKRWKTYTHNKTVAKQQEAMIKTDLMKGGIKGEKGRQPITFKGLAEFYLARPEVKRHATYKWKDSTIRTHFVPVFQSTHLQDITPLMIEAFRESRRQDQGKQGTTLKVATINRNLALLKNMFGFAVREGWLERNPVSLVKFERENNVRDRVLDPGEFDRLQAHSAPHLQAINLMAYQTGMRVGEILRLTWKKVDLKANLIRLKAEDTKTDDARLIPLTPELTHLLRELYKVPYLHEDHVFLVKGQSVNAIKTAFNAACRRAEISGFRFHDFRHTAITNMRRAGIDHLTIMKISGHKT